MSRPDGQKIEELLSFFQRLLKIQNYLVEMRETLEGDTTWSKGAWW